jgi:glycine/D-amino acid oxidase-like deaminating enzyme
MRSLLMMVLVLAACDDVSPRQVDCEVVVVGGGAGGLHTAFRLAATMGDRVCLVEKESRLGGRIYDVPMDAADPNSPRFGTGARRVMEGQNVLFGLASELGLTLEKPAVEADLISARGLFGFAKDDLLPAYPHVAPDNDPMADQETWLYDKLRKGPGRAQAANYPEFRSYIRDIAGDEEYHFLRDMSRFRADFEYPLDARGYLEYLDEEWDVCCTASYPVGGMSAFIRGMEAKATGAGARFFLGEPVNEISRFDGRYRVRAAQHDFVADKVVIAVPPTGVDKMKGDVVEAIRRQAQYQAIIAVKVVTVTQWWPEAWWENVVNPGQAADNHVWRAWTTEHCLNFIEIPLEAYGKSQKATRSVYDDDANCVAFWEEIAHRGSDQVEAEIERGLKYLFNNNGISMPVNVTIPRPKKTHVQVWPDAWHWLRAGSSITNAQLADWAVEPLAGENVALVGEAYNVQRSGWSDGAYKSSIKLLAAKYGVQVPMASALSRPARPHARGAGGH